MRRQSLFIILILLCLGSVLRAAEVMPPRPKEHFNDYANLVQPPVAAELNQQLEQFERDTSNQIVVAIYPKMQSDSSIEDYTVRVAQNWQVGQKVKKNGVVLFIFKADRTMCIQTGYGLEGALPDVLCKRIIEDEIKPHFKQNDYDGGLTAGVNAILAATKGEYKGTGEVVHHLGTFIGWLPILIFLFIIGVAALSTIRRGTTYDSYSQSSLGWRIGGALLNMLVNSTLSSGSSRGGWSSSSGGSDSGGGGFSSGGGSFGGGGASGSW